jgi:AraC-like DNA-binding protein
MDKKLTAEELVLEPPVSRLRCTSPPEEDALRRLALLDLAGARSSFEAVLADTVRHALTPAQASYLLYDLLSRVERVAAEHQGIPQRGIAERMVTVQRLAAVRTQEDLLWTFWTLYDAITKPLHAPARFGHPAVEQVKDFVRENYNHKIALAEIARVVGVSRNYLSHLFRRHCGLTVTEFIHRTRMKRAESLLGEGGLTVSEIAYLVGYQNYRDFHRNFVKYEKTSPKKFRQFRALNRRPASLLPP